MSHTIHVKDLLLSVLDQPAWVLVGAPIALTAAYIVLSGIRNIFFHPLSHIPGPRLAAFTQFYYSYYWLSSYYPQHVLSLHDRYGPIVRLSPTYVSFSSASSWKEIYGHTSASHKPFLKQPAFYAADSEAAMSIVNETHPVRHAKTRKLLSNAFSAKSLGEQEGLVHSYIDALVTQIGRHATGAAGAEMVRWYNWATFDIIGDLAFGDPFDGLKKGEAHYWVRSVLDSVTAGTWIVTLVSHVGHGPLFPILLNSVVPANLRKQRERHLQYSTEKMVKRMHASPNARKDFLSKILSEKDNDAELTVRKLSAQSAVLVVAGSETTATFMSGTTYYLCRTPHTYKALTDEIRSTFANYSDITAQKAEHCKYLNAVVNEGLRIFPPVPVGLPRVSPGAEVNGTYIPAGYIVSTNSYAATHSETNFSRPYEFLPERWLPDSPTPGDNKEASQPFLLGSRVCLGRNLAMVEMRLMLAKMLWVFDMELLDDELDWDRDAKTMTLWTKPDLTMRYRLREGVEMPPVPEMMLQ